MAVVTTKVKISDPTKAKEYFEAKMAFTTGPIELERMMNEDSDINIIDVRASEDYDKGHIPGAINLPKAKWDKFSGLSRDKTNILYCYSQVCHLAATAAVKFTGEGYPIMELEGGFRTWKEFGLEIEK